MALSMDRTRPVGAPAGSREAISFTAPARRPPQSAPILLDHAGAERAEGPWRKDAVSPVRFAEHLELVARAAYTTITVSQLAGALAQGGMGLPVRPLLLTFDEGFADFHTAVLPLLRRYAFTATLYPPTAYSGGQGRWAGRTRLAWAQLAEISDLIMNGPRLPATVPARVGAAMRRSLRRGGRWCRGHTQAGGGAE